MRTPNAALSVVVLSLFAACPQPPAPDAGTDGGTALTGGGGGSATGGGAGGGNTGGGSAGGGSAGGGSGIDAGLPSCTFEPPFDLGPTDPTATGNFTSALAVTASGEAIYAWNDGQSVHWRVQSPTGVLGPEFVDVDAGGVPSVHLVAAGDRALLAYATLQGSVFETRTRRYTSAGGWEAVQKVAPDSATTGLPVLAMEPDGTASLWRQDDFGSSPIVEYSSTGAGPIANPHPIASGGFLYGATRNGGVRLALTLAATSIPPVARFSDGSGDVTVPLPGAQYSGNDRYHAAIADDGSAVVGGQFALNGLVVVGAVTRAGGVTSQVDALSTYTDAGFDAHEMIGVLAGSGGQGLVVWLDLPALSIWTARRPAGGTWGAPQLVGFSDRAIPRFSKLSSTRGLVHYYTPQGARRVELNVDGFVGAPVMSNDFPGAVFGVEYAASHAHAAAIKSTTAGDGGWIARAAQCR